MNILLLGSGGREHALAWKISQSDEVDNLYIAPGNAGTSSCGTNVAISANDFDAVAHFVKENKVNMVIVGPEEPLVLGIADYFLSNNELKNIPVIGPSKQGAMLEGSKDFAKQFMIRHNIPTARYQSFCKGDEQKAADFLATLQAPYVLKADGLAAGKGVLILNDLEEAKNELNEMLSGKFGDAGNTVVIEEFLSGIELSVFVLTDGKSYLILPEAKDYKRIGEGDTGPNTGGMGAVSPVSFASKEFMKKVEDCIIRPTVEGLQKDNISYKGFIFFGLINVGGDPYTIEYNCRMGDPETEVVIPRVQNDIVELFQAVADENLNEKEIYIDSRYATTVMQVSGGYPGDYKKGIEINGLQSVEEGIVFHAGTKHGENGKVLTNGGRVIAFTSYGKSMFEALNKSYRNAAKVNFDGVYFRRDIGFDL